MGRFATLALPKKTRFSDVGKPRTRFSEVGIEQPADPSAPPEGFIPEDIKIIPEQFPKEQFPHGVLVPAPEKTFWQKAKGFFVGEPQYGRWTEPTRQDYLHRAIGVPINIITKFSSGRTFGADKLLWYTISKIRPDLADRPLEDQINELNPIEQSTLSELSGDIAEFIGQIQSATKLLKGFGLKSPQGRRFIDRLASKAPPWMTSGAIEAVVEGVTREKDAKQIAKDVATNSLIRGGEAVVWTGVEIGAGKLFGWALNKFPRFRVGWQKWVKGKSPEQVRPARAEVDEAIRIYKETGDRTAWDNVRIKYAGITPEGVQRIRARAAPPPPVKEFGKFPLAKAKPAPRVAPIVKPPVRIAEKPPIPPTAKEIVAPERRPTVPPPEVAVPAKVAKPEITPKPLITPAVTAKERIVEEKAPKIVAPKAEPIISNPEVAKTLKDAKPDILTGIKTGKSVSVDVVRGFGRKTKGEIYESGEGEPAFGEGRYSAIDETVAKHFGPQIEKLTVQLDNPFVLTNDKQLAELVGEPVPRENVARRDFLKKAREAIEQQGYDGIIINVPNFGDVDTTGKSAKRLIEISGATQVVEFAPTPKPEIAKPAPTELKPLPGETKDQFRERVRAAKEISEPAKEIVIAKPSEVVTKIPKAPKVPVTETPTIPLKGKEAQIFREEIRTQEKITTAEEGEVGLEPAGASFTDHIDTFQSYQLPTTSQIPRLTKQMKKINGLRLSGKITPQQANQRIHKLRQLLIRQAVKEKIALRTSKKGKIKIALRESGVFVPEEVATYGRYKDIEPMLGGGQDITRAIQQMDGALPIKEKLKIKGQAGPIERFVLWRTRKMTLQKLNWLKEKTIEIRGILSIRKGSKEDKQINLILEKIGTADRDIPIKDVLGKETFASMSKGNVKAAQELRQFYDDLIEEQNAARLMRGQDEIPYRQNYSPQILRDTTVWEQLFLRDKTAKILEKKDLPDYIKPNAPFNPRAQAREADMPYDKRVLSARELAESYIITASKDIFNTSIIQNNKAFIDQLRGQGLEKSAEYLAEWTATSFAGIKPRLDRAIKLPKWAAGSLKYFNRLRNLAVFPLNVAWSLSTQPLSLSNTIGRYGLPNTVRGFFQWLKPSIRRQAAQDYFSFVVKSTRRGGVTRQDASNLLGENIKTQKTVGEFVENFSTIVLTEMEKLLTGTSIRAAHITGKKRGLKGEALKQFASDGGGKTQSMYNDEDKPMILRSLLVKSAAPYQTYAFEVANTFREWAGRTGTPPDSKLYAMWSIARWLAALTVLKMIANSVRGRKWSWWDLIPIPFREFWLTPIARKLTGEFVPGSAGLPAPIETATRIAKGINDVLETGNWRKLRNEMLRYGPGVFKIPGGVQWARMVDAIIIYSSGGLTDRQGRIMFEMKSVTDLARAMFTGIWSTKAGRERLKPSKKEEERIF